MPKTQTDFELMQAIRRGDAEGLRTLYARYSGKVYAICLRVIHDQHEAEETLLDVFHEIWQRSDRFDDTRSSPRQYIQLLARSRAIDRLRESKRRRDKVECGFLPELAATEHEQSSDVSHVLGGLEPRYQQVIELAFFSGCSHSQIAEQLQIPLGTVKTRIRTAIATLRRRMREGTEQ